jgi:hypothetical protein
VPPFTVAVKVIVWPNRAGFAEEARVVVVAVKAAACAVAMTNEVVPETSIRRVRNSERLIHVPRRKFHSTVR